MDNGERLADIALSRVVRSQRSLCHLSRKTGA